MKIKMNWKLINHFPTAKINHDNKLLEKNKKYTKHNHTLLKICKQCKLHEKHSESTAVNQVKKPMKIKLTYR